MKVKLIFVTAGYLPFPPIKGGAVEDLLHQFVLQNEIHKKYEVLILSTCKKEDISIMQKFNHTEVKYLFTDTKTYRVNSVISKMRKLIGNKVSFYASWCRKIIVKETSTNCVIIENNPWLLPAFEDLNVPVYFHAHNDYFKENRWKSKGGVNTKVKFIAISEYIKKCILSGSKQGDIEPDVLVVPNSVSVSNSLDQDEITCFHQEFCEKHKIDLNTRIILFTGRIIKEKGVKQLVQAFSKIDCSYNVALVLVGADSYSGNLSSSYIQEVKENATKSQNQIIFTGYQEHGVVEKLIRISSFGVIPSIWQEPAALSAIEMMCLSLPVIHSNSGGISEYLAPSGNISVDLGNGFVTRLYNAIICYLEEPSLLEDIKGKSRKNSSKYTPQAYYNRMSDAIEEFLM